MKQTILTNWTFSRLLRLVLGVVIIMQAISAKDIPIGIMGLILTMMPVFNIGCCGVNGCYTPVKKVADTSEGATYEEVV